MSGNHGQLFRPCLTSKAWHKRYFFRTAYLKRTWFARSHYRVTYITFDKISCHWPLLQSLCIIPRWNNFGAVRKKGSVFQSIPSWLLASTKSKFLNSKVLRLRSSLRVNQVSFTNGNNKAMCTHNCLQSCSGHAKLSLIHIWRCRRS